jgi:hypothetical protein
MTESPPGPMGLAGIFAVCHEEFMKRFNRLKNNYSFNVLFILYSEFCCKVGA